MHIFLTKVQSRLQKRSKDCSQIQHQSPSFQKQKESENLKSSQNIIECGDHHMQLNTSKRGNADPHHGEADLAVPNFVRQEMLQHHRRNKSWNCALTINIR